MSNIADRQVTTVVDLRDSNQREKDLICRVWGGTSFRHKSAVWQDYAMHYMHDDKQQPRRATKCNHCGIILTYNNGTTAMMQHSARCKQRQIQEGELPTVAAGQKRLDGYLQKRDREENPLDLMVNTWAELFLPFSVIENAWFRRTFLDCIGLRITVSRNQLCSATMGRAYALKKDILLSMQNSPLTIAIDGGSIIRKYLGVSLVCNSRAWFWSIPQVDHQDGVTVERVLQEVYSEVSSVTIPLAVVGDNHSGIQGGFAAFTQRQQGTVSLRCAAHCLQLVVSDIMRTDEGVRATHKGVSELLQSLTIEEVKQLSKKIPAPNLTRWDSKYRCWKQVFNLRQEIDRIRPTIKTQAWFRNLFACTEQLSAFKVATDLLQSDRATIVTEMLVLCGLLVLEASLQVLKPRITKNFNSLPLRVAVIYSPGFMSAVPRECLPHVFSVASEFCSVAAHYTVRMTGWSLAQATQELQKQSDAYFLHARAAREITASSFQDHWSALMRTHVDLVRAVKAYTSLAPSEASVERLFSCVGRMLTKSRNRLLDAHMAAQTFIKFNSAHLREMLDAPVEIEAPDPDAVSPDMFGNTTPAAVCNLFYLLLPREAQQQQEQAQVEDDFHIEQQRLQDVHAVEQDVERERNEEEIVYL
jgi:hypothetical protein